MQGTASPDAHILPGAGDFPLQGRTQHDLSREDRGGETGGQLAPPHTCPRSQDTELGSACPTLTSQRGLGVQQSLSLARGRSKGVQEPSRLLHVRSRLRAGSSGQGQNEPVNSRKPLSILSSFFLPLLLWALAPPNSHILPGPGGASLPPPARVGLGRLQLRAGGPGGFQPNPCSFLLALCHTAHAQGRDGYVSGAGKQLLLRNRDMLA